MSEEQSVVLFPNSQAAIRAERLLQTEGMACKLIPAPRQFTAECGLALRFERAEADRVRALLDQAGIGYQAIHDL